MNQADLAVGESAPHDNGETDRVRVYRSLQAARACWQAIENHGDAYAFQSWRWLNAWFDTIGAPAGLEPCIAVAESASGTPLMLLPLAIEQRRGCRCLVWMGGQLTDYHAPLLAKDFGSSVDSARFRVLWQRVLDAVPGHDVIVIEKQPDTVGDQPNPFRQLGGTPHPSHAHLVHLEGDFDTFLARMRSAKSRSTDRRKRRKLAAQGTLSFVVAGQDGAEAQRLLDAVIRQKSANYRELGVADLFASEAQRNFLRALCQDDDEPPLVHLSGLLLGERIVATHFGLLHKQRLYYLLPAYERGEVSTLSPGSAHLHYLLRWCFANDVKVCDFTVGDEPYKYLWRDAELELVDYVQPVSARGRLYALAWNSARRIKRRIKQSPALLAAVLGWRARLASIGTRTVHPRQSEDQRD